MPKAVAPQPAEEKPAEPKEDKPAEEKPAEPKEDKPENKNETDTI